LQKVGEPVGHDEIDSSDEDHGAAPLAAMLFDSSAHVDIVVVALQQIVWRECPVA
jgi:hypothetical protein